ncbi:MAG: NAD(P)-dependent oxidoreductase [Bacteroidales bacterium]
MQKSKMVLQIDETHNILPQKLKSKGYIVDFCPQYAYEDVLNNISKYDAILVRSKINIDKAIIDRAKYLKCIARSGAGMDAIDIKYAESKNIKCLNSPEGNRDAVGEHTLGLLLTLFNKINFADSEVRKGLWHREENRGIEVKGKTIGIIGYGNMGHAFAQRLQGFECQVIAYDKYKQGFSDSFAQEVTLQELFQQTDVLSLHVPLTDETNKMINSEFISHFSKPIYLLNTSRGKIVSLHDLVKALQGGKIKGCGLDVLEIENFNQQIQVNEQQKQDLFTLYNMNNTVLTPHVAGWTRESYYKLADFLADKIIEILG